MGNLGNAHNSMYGSGKQILSSLLGQDTALTFVACGGELCPDGVCPTHLTHGHMAAMRETMRPELPGKNNQDTHIVVAMKLPSLQPWSDPPAVPADYIIRKFGARLN